MRVWIAAIMLTMACGRVDFDVDPARRDPSNTDTGTDTGDGLGDAGPPDTGMLPSAALGEVDVSFGAGGWVVTSYDDALDERAYAITTSSPDGYITMGTLRRGRGYADFQLVRYLHDGTRDVSFAEAGFALHRFGAGYSYGYAIGVIPSGGYLIYGDNSYGGQDDVTAARVFPSGSVDTTFGASGIYRAGFASQDAGSAVVVGDDGSFVGCGTVNYPGPDSGILVVRAHADGSADTTFGMDGIVRLDPLGTASDGCAGLAVSSTGQIVVVGVSDGAFTVASLSSSGVPDPSFATDGALILSRGSAGDVAIDPMGRIVVVGSLDGDAVIVRALADGSLDPSFGAGGITKVDLGDRDHLHTVTLEPTGRIVTGGGGADPATGSASRDVVFIRLDESGVVDRTFGTGGDGTVRLDLGGDDIVHDLVILPDGRIVATGTTLDAATELHSGFVVRLR